MSHFAVAVFHKNEEDIYDLLAPYDENTKVDPYIDFTKDQAIEYAKKHVKNADQKTEQELFDHVAQDYKDIDENGNIWTTYNPKSKWDWWVPGGRFCNFLDGRCVDEKWIEYGYSARVKDIDFSQDEETYEQCLESWDTIIRGNESFYNPEYFKEYYDGREDYARRNSNFTTMAVVTPDGEWHEVGQIGWFGTSSDTPEERKDWDCNYKARFIDTADPDWILTIVDCHI